MKPDGCSKPGLYKSSSGRKVLVGDQGGLLYYSNSSNDWYPVASVIMGDYELIDPDPEVSISVKYKEPPKPSTREYAVKNPGMYLDPCGRGLLNLDGRLFYAYTDGRNSSGDLESLGPLTFHDANALTKVTNYEVLYTKAGEPRHVIVN